VSILLATGMRVSASPRGMAASNLLLPLDGSRWGQVLPTIARAPGTECTPGNDGQGVSSKDARAMAKALHRALTALKPKQKLTAEQRRAWTNEHVGVFSVFDLAAYADKGGFAIA
jgi:hypothetical protein